MSITTSHTLAKELLSKPDGFITMTVKNKEYMISHTQRKRTCANYDDSSMYWTLCGDYECEGNIKK